MASVNRVILIGNLGRDPELRYLTSGEAVATLSIATTDKFKDRNGEVQEVTEWHRVGFFGRTAEVCGQYLKKGAQVYVEGSIRTRKYTDKDGAERYVTEIRGERMQMLGGPAQSQPRPQQPAPAGTRDDYARASGGNAPSGRFDDFTPF